MSGNRLTFSATLDDKVSKGLTLISKRFKESNTQASLLGNVGAKAVAKGFSLVDSAISGAIGFVGDATDAASNLNEETSKSAVIFGKNAGAIQDWAASGAESLGLSKRAALEAASGFAGLFSTVGIGLDESTDMAKKITGLGSDLASFFNTDMQTALDALKSGLSGESEPLRRFNVFLSETAVTSKLTQMGVKKVGGAFTESQKATGRYALILEQTSSAQGDFARTSDGLANSQRAVDAALENTQARLGQKFLPVAKQITQWQIDFIEGGELVVGTLGDMGRGFEGFAKTADDFLPRDTGDVLEERLQAIAENAVVVKGDLHRTFGEIADDIGLDARTMRAEIAGFGSSLDGAGSAADRLAIKVGFSNESIIESFNKLHSDMETLGQGVADAMYDPIIAKSELATLDLEAKRQRNLRDQAAAGSIERTEAQNTLNQVNKDTIAVLTTLASHGDKASQERLLTMAAEAKSTGKLTSEQAAAWNLLTAAVKRYKSAANLPIRDDITNTGHGRASGGPVVPGQTYTVGEEGTERLVMHPGGGGYVIPGAGGGGGRKSMQPIVIITKTYLDKRQIAEAVNEERYWDPA